jgi:hypothetical protein
MVGYSRELALRQRNHLDHGLGSTSGRRSNVGTMVLQDLCKHTMADAASECPVFATDSFLLDASFTHIRSERSMKRKIL